MERRIPTLDEFINESVDNTNLYLQYFMNSCQLAIAGQQENGLNIRNHEWINTPEMLKLKVELDSKKNDFRFGEHQQERTKVEGTLMKNGFVRINGNDHGLKYEYIGIAISSLKDALKAVKEIIDAHEEVTSKMSVLDSSLFVWTKRTAGSIGDYYKGISLITNPMIKIFNKLGAESYVASDFEYTKAEAAYNEVTTKGKLLFTDDFTKTFLKGDLPDHNIDWYELRGSYYFVSYPRHKTYIVIKLKNKPIEQDSFVAQL
jgi:hypothetical protein